MAQRTLVAVDVLISMLVGMGAAVIGVAMTGVRIRMTAVMGLRGLGG